jgi:hypothetical protein
VLAFPNPRRWTESFRIRRGARGHRFTFDLHRASGLYVFPITLVLSVSGVAFNWPDATRAAVNAVSPDPAVPSRRPPVARPRLDRSVRYDRGMQRRESVRERAAA